jgi:hypothetical protein
VKSRQVAIAAQPAFGCWLPWRAFSNPSAALKNSVDHTDKANERLEGASLLDYVIPSFQR